MAVSRNLLSASATNALDELEPLPHRLTRLLNPSNLVIRAQQTDSPLESIYEVGGSCKAVRRYCSFTALFHPYSSGHSGRSSPDHG